MGIKVVQLSALLLSCSSHRYSFLPKNRGRGHMVALPFLFQKFDPHQACFRTPSKTYTQASYSPSSLLKINKRSRNPSDNFLVLPPAPKPIYHPLMDRELPFEPTNWKSLGQDICLLPHHSGLILPKTCRTASISVPPTFFFSKLSDKGPMPVRL